MEVETTSISAQEPTSPVSEAVSSAADAVTSNLDAIHTPLQYGDFAALGLSGWSPAGVVQWSMEIINTTTHLPWFWTIVAGTAFWRLVVGPTSIIGLRNTSRIQPYQNEVQRVQAEMNDAVKKSDMIGRQKAALKLKAIYDKAGVNVATGFLPPLFQIPATLGIFFGVKWMCNLPVEQMKWSGLAMLPDLTVPDPTWVLPILVTALVNVQISVGKNEMDLKTRPGMGHLMNGLRLLSVVSIAIMASFPAVSVSFLSFHAFLVY
jgi:YidC/Oxa1 family membrane protein insertase